jgi:asparagine synthase (glutamine-hydrolysing)
MCSILGVLELREEVDREALRARVLELSRLQRHRGPDWSGVHTCPGAVLAHERLAIVDVVHGAQPLLSPDGEQALAVNGEIYNHQDLRETVDPDYGFATDSDCEVILPLYLERGTDFLNDLIGIFAFVLYDEARDRYVVARDPMGVVPLYMGWDDRGLLYVASEMKALTPVCRTVREFPPGHVLDSHALEDAVHRQLMSDVPYGVLLSGGLDSSIIAAVANKYAARRVEDHDQTQAWWPRLHSFSIGLEGSPDLAAAQVMADHIGTVHHEFHFAVQEGLDALRDVIYHLETYDVTTIRASTPMYLLARRIRAMGIKMVLSGEGADEIFGGYLYFHKAPDSRAFHDETIRKLDRLHSYDCLRANKSTAAWGVEARVPFLDQAFLDVAMSLDPAVKMVGADGVEKRILRDAFRDLLHDSVFRRQKEQFSDGVGYGWIDSLKDHASAQVSDRELEHAATRFPVTPPATKEAYFYRTIFEEHFPLPGAAATVPGGPSVACSTPEALAWDESLRNVTDPSGRSVLGVHRDDYSSATR